jgi:hypothetical protein
VVATQAEATAPTRILWAQLLQKNFDKGNHLGRHFLDI